MSAWNVKRILDWAIDFFKKKNIPQPRLSAELLLGEVLSFSRMQLYLNYNYKLNSSELTKYKEYIKKRLNHTPIQYILNKAHFRNITLYVDEDVMIPRPETELVVEKVIELLHSIIGSNDVKSLDGKINILEIGVGSGAISISLAHEMGRVFEDNNLSWSIIATDSSNKAVKIAQRNAENILAPEKIANLKFVHCDIVPKPGSPSGKTFKNRFNIIVSNPPYISEEDFWELPREVKDFEPESSLLAGKTGLEVYRRIISKIGILAAENICYLILEVDSKVTRNLAGLVKEKLSPESVKIEKDYNQKDRIMVVKI